MALYAHYSLQLFPRLNDSFPVDVVEKLIRLALDCVHVEPDKRPNMTSVASKISDLYLQSWSDIDKVKLKWQNLVSFLFLSQILEGY